jgi:hypothetical protein
VTFFVQLDLQTGSGRVADHDANEVAIPDPAAPSHNGAWRRGKAPSAACDAKEVVLFDGTKCFMIVPA